MATTQFLTMMGSKFCTMLIAGAITYALSRLFKMKPTSIALENSRRRALIALGSLVIVIVVATGFLVSYHSFTTSMKETQSVDGSSTSVTQPRCDSIAGSISSDPSFQDTATQPASSDSRPESQEALRSGPEDVFVQLLVFFICYSPFFIAMRWGKEALSSAGINRQFLSGSIVIGLTIGVIWTLTALMDKSFQTDWRVAHFWALLEFAVVGFSEEFAFRGYLQTRLIAWLGKYSGWLCTSGLFALSHFSIRVIIGGMDPTEAMLNCLALVPSSLFLGFVMLRTGSVVAPGIIHTFINWIETL